MLNYQHKAAHWLLLRFMNTKKMSFCAIIAGSFFLQLILLLNFSKYSEANVHLSRPSRSDHSQQCIALYGEHRCRPEYVQTRARFFLYCKNIYVHLGGEDLISEYPCLRHENGTRCETLIAEKYYESSLYSWYDPDSNRSCSYSECSEECFMILQHLKDTWGCCFHELAEYFYQPSLMGFTVNYDHPHNFWHLCGIQPPQACPYDINPMVTDPVECSNREQFGQYSSEYQCAPLPRFLSEIKSCDLMSEICAFKDGKRCKVLLYYSNLTDNLYTRAFQECPRTGDFCTADCKTTLQSLRDHVGCCLHIDNGTDLYLDRYRMLRYGLWRACGIEPPGKCSSVITQLWSGSDYSVVVSLNIIVLSVTFLIIILF